MRCPQCSARVTPLAASPAAGAAALRAPEGGGADGPEGDGGADGKIPVSCPACQSTFVLDERATLVSARGRARVVSRPEGIVIVEGGAEEGPIYRSAHRDADVRLGVFNPHFGRLGPIVAAAACCYATVALMKVLRHLPWVDYLPLVGVLAFYLVTYAGFRLWPRLRGPSHQLCLTREAVIAIEHGREVVRCPRDEIARVECAGDPPLRAGERRPAPRHTLSAFDAAGRRFLLWSDVPSRHGAFAEVWLEEQLGLSDRGSEDEEPAEGDEVGRVVE